MAGKYADLSNACRKTTSPVSLGERLRTYDLACRAPSRLETNSNAREKSWLELIQRPVPVREPYRNACAVVSVYSAQLPLKDRVSLSTTRAHLPEVGVLGRQDLILVRIVPGTHQPLVVPYLLSRRVDRVVNAKGFPRG